MIIKIPRSECYSHGMTDTYTPIEYEHQPTHFNSVNFNFSSVCVQIG